MGIRVEFHVLHDGTPEAALIENLSTFRAWCERWQASDPDGAPWPTSRLSFLDRIQIRGAEALDPTDADEAREIDAVADLFFGDFCDHGPGAALLAPASGAMWYLRHYVAVARKAGEGWSERMHAAWSHLVRGRALGDATREWAYVPSDAVFRLGFWRVKELAWIANDISASPSDALAEREVGALKAVMEAVTAASRLGSDLLITVA